MQRVDQDGRRIFRSQNHPMGAQQHAMSVTKAVGQGFTVLAGLNMPDLTHDRHTRRPTRGMEIHDFDLGALGHGHRRGQLHVIMDHRPDIGSPAIDLGMDDQFAGRLIVAFQNVAVEVDQQNAVGRHLGAALGAALYVKLVLARHPHGNMAGIVQDARHVE